MNNLFNFDGTGVEVITLDGEVLFDAESVAYVLGYTRTQTTKGVEYVNVRWDVISKMLSKEDYSFSTNNGKRYLTEPMVYCLAFHSRKPEAKAFRHWVYEEVLPSIRQTGMYIEGMSREEILEFSNKLLTYANAAYQSTLEPGRKSYKKKYLNLTNGITEIANKLSKTYKSIDK